MRSNYYKILNIEIGADSEEVKKAYRKLAIKYHPDKNPNDKIAEQKFRDITEAYEILKDFEKRKKYDFENGFDIARRKKTDNREVKTTEDINNEQMGQGKPNVVIDPNGEVYVDLGRMAKDSKINTSFFRVFFGR